MRGFLEHKVFLVRRLDRKRSGLPLTTRLRDKNLLYVREALSLDFNKSLQRREGEILV